MKRFIAVSLILMMCVMVSGCGNSRVIGGVEYDTYGLMNKDENRSPKIQYEVIWGNVFWGVIFAETLIAPIYFFGFSLFEPVGEIS